jgi:hypothetical protein
LWTWGVTLAVAAGFYAPAAAACRWEWPAPLDDVYIHYDFARAWALGHPFEWVVGQGYSSGETSPAYAVILAVGYAAGFRGGWIGVWAAIVACVALVLMAHALRRLVQPAPSWVAVVAVPLLFACGTLDFAWFSGMEVAVFGAVASALLVAVRQARAATPVTRGRKQWCVGLLGGALVLVRPEAAVIVAVTTVAVARRPGAFSPLAAAVRVALPGATATLGLAALNRIFTGSAAAAGALLKLLSSNPFATDEDRAREYVVNLVSFVRAMVHDLGGGSWRLTCLLPILAALSLASRRTRALGALCLSGGFAFALLVSWNGASRHQNLRDFMPVVALMLFAAALGLAAVARRTVGRVLGAGTVLVTIGLAGSQVPEAARFYVRASRNIHDQQVAVGRRLAAESPADAIVLVGDAGAIPYISGLHAVDALGLGGYHSLPFVRAAVHGEAATLELIERLPSAMRPTVLALYPNWFPGITGTFGHERGRVTISDNVICGGVTKGIYDADWSSLRSSDETGTDDRLGGPVLDELDVADVVSEETHGYVSPAPRGGWTLFDVRADGSGAARFDGGRIVPAGEEESFLLATDAPAGAQLVIRTDDSRFEATVRATPRIGAPLEVPLVRAPTRATSSWSLARARFPVPLEPAVRVHLVVTGGSLHDFHAWLVGGKP